jgi:hypothetical protein
MRPKYLHKKKKNYETLLPINPMLKVEIKKKKSMKPRIPKQLNIKR